MLIVTMAGKSLSFMSVAIGRAVRIVNNRRAIHELALLDDRGLKDIGLTRSDVAGALASSWHQDPSQILAERAGPSRAAAARRGMTRRVETLAAPNRRKLPSTTVACSA